jgi:hypothetical protein
MLDKVTALFRPGSEGSLDYAQEVMERTLQLTRSQLDVTENMFSEASREYRELLAAEDPSALLQNFQNVLQSNARIGTEATAAFLKNAISYQNELIQMVQNTMPELSRQLREGMTAVMPTAAAVAEASAARASRQSSGGRAAGRKSNGFGASKAA